MSNNGNKIIVLEGLPGTGKTTLGKLFEKEILVIPEMVLDQDVEKEQDELFYFKNDLEKLRRAKENKGTVLVERSYVSTLAHNYAMLKIDGKKDYYTILEAFAKNKKEGKLIPDLYIKLEIGVKNSLIRKNRPVSKEDIWTQEKYLEAISEYYKNYFDIIEPDIKKMTIDAEKDLNTIYEEIKINLGKIENG